MNINNNGELRQNSQENNQGDNFEVDVNNMQVLQDNRTSLLNESQSPGQPAGKTIDSQAAAAPENKQDGVQNVEDDGNGFFITGINTGDDMGGETQQQFEQIEEEQTMNHYDPADNYKHVAVVDCSKAFSNQEVSYSFF